MSLTAATYGVNLHCPECALRIKSPLLRTPGVHKVDVNFDKSEVKVIGSIDAKKIHQRIEKISKKKVETLKVEANFKDTIVVTKVVKEIKEPIVYSTTLKAHLHCDECERHLRKRLLRHKGIYNVKSDMKAQTVAIEGAIEAEKLVKLIKSKVHKHVEIVSTKEVVKKEEVVKEEKKKEVKEEIKKEASKVEGEEKKKEVIEKEIAIKKVIDIKEVKEVEEKLKATTTPYIVHYVYAPQWFSDEDPNSCCIL